jgi:hypothetical protein
MTCPSDIATILLDILQLGVLQARAAGWSGDAAGAATAADHIHNLAAILQQYSSQALEYYWVAERPAFLARCPVDWAERFQPHWDRLQMHVERLGTPVGVH